VVGLTHTIGDHMSLYREPGVLERQKSANAAKKALLEKFKAKADDPGLAEKVAARAAIAEARAVRQAEREAQREAERVRRAHEEQVAAQLAAEQKLAAEAEAARLAAVAAEQHIALLAEQKAARDARYAARKADKKKRRKG